MKSLLKLLLAAAILAAAIPTRTIADETAANAATTSTAAAAATPANTTNSSKITILGAVNRPGNYSLDHPNLLVALAEAGGWDRIANIKQIRIYHLRADGNYSPPILANLTGPIDQSPFDKYILQPGDVVVVAERLL